MCITYMTDRQRRLRETDRQAERDVAPHQHQSRRFKEESVQCETYSRSKLLIKLIDDLKVHVLVVIVIII